MAYKPIPNTGNMFYVPPGSDGQELIDAYNSRYTGTSASPVSTTTTGKGNAPNKGGGTHSDVPSTGSAGVPDWYDQLVNGKPGQSGGQTTQQGALTNLPGVSQTTKDTINQAMSGGYQPSENVNAALNELNGIIAKQPGEFQSQYIDQLNGIMDQLLNREGFEYDLNSDPMYQQLRQQYMSQGRRSMQDTMGQAAALTGGYGNSWAATAGQMAYDQHLQSLNERIPELYGMALQGYQLEGDQLQQQLDALNDAYNREYGQYQDTYNRWQAERDYFAGRYDSERDFDYGSYSDDLDRWFDVAGMENDQYNADRDYQLSQQQLALQQQQLAQAQSEADRQYALELALQMVEHGKEPSYDLLMQAGYSMEDIMNMEAGRNGGSSTSRSGGTTYSSQPAVTTGGDGFVYSLNGGPEMSEEEYLELLHKVRAAGNDSTPYRTTGPATLGTYR